MTSHIQAHWWVWMKKERKMLNLESAGHGELVATANTGLNYWVSNCPLFEEESFVLCPSLSITVFCVHTPPSTKEASVKQWQRICSSGPGSAGADRSRLQSVSSRDRKSLQGPLEMTHTRNSPTWTFALECSLKARDLGDFFIHVQAHRIWQEDGYGGFMSPRAEGPASSWSWRAGSSGPAPTAAVGIGLGLPLLLLWEWGGHTDNPKREEITWHQEWNTSLSKLIPFYVAISD